MAAPFFTIGHSTHPIAEFAGLLHEVDIRLVVDVRTVPRSRKNPQFNAAALEDVLRTYRIGYEHAAALGGLRGRQRNVPTETNGFWKNDSFHNFADYAMGSEFQAGLARLRELGHSTRCAVMCAEAVWWRCHRRIVADYLIAGGETVFHILGPKHIDTARMSEGARPGPDGVLTYPARDET